jgi:beta-lactamase class A
VLTLLLSVAFAGPWLAGTASLAPSTAPQAKAPPAAISDPALRQKLDALIAASGAEVAVAFRTLDGKLELFIQPNAVFHAASTMKVPVMIELFRQSEAGFFKLDDRLPVVNSFKSIVDESPYELSAADEDEKDLYKAAGQTRTYRELCELMITVSSNLATNILIEKLGVEKVQQTSLDMGGIGMNIRRGVEDSKAFRAGLNNTTTARALLVLLEAIAHEGAVSPAASRQMIEILKRQRFNDAIPAGLPPGTVVAHKTGSITRIQHDAAVVYGPRPYVLVVLVRGIDDEARSKALIADIARAVHGSL